MESQITNDIYAFDVAKEYICLSSVVTIKNYVSLKMKLRISLSSRDLSCATKHMLYKSLILSVVLYGAKVFTLFSIDVAALKVFVTHCYVRSLTQCEVAMSCMSSSTT